MHFVIILKILLTSDNIQWTYKQTLEFFSHEIRFQEIVFFSVYKNFCEIMTNLSTIPHYEIRVQY